MKNKLNIAMTLAVIMAMVITSLALADALNGDALYAQSGTQDVINRTVAGGDTVTYDFSAWVANTGGASDNVFPGSLNVDITRAGDWLNTSSGTPTSFTFTGYETQQTGTIVIFVPCDSQDTLKEMTVLLESDPSSNGKSLDSNKSSVTLKYRITAGANGLNCAPPPPSDADNDSVPDTADNCPSVYNPNQADADNDGLGDACDPTPNGDTDGDGVDDGLDNCIGFYNPDQADADSDKLGNACDANSYAPEIAIAATDAGGNEGDTLSTSGSFSDADGNGTLTITKVSGTGTVTQGLDGAWSWSLPTTDNGSGTVVVQAYDGEHAVATDTFDWSAANVAPTATFGDNGPVDEGSAFNLSLTNPYDPSSADTVAGFTYAFDCGDGTGYGAFGTSNTASCPTTDNGTRSVGGKIMDKDGGVSEYTGSVTVNNVAPTLSALSLSGNSGTACMSGNTVTLSFSFFDPGTADTFTGSINWGDGSPITSFVSSPVSASHTYSAGIYTISVTVSDDDGGSDSDTGAVSFLYNTSGILQPINLTGPRSSFKVGSTIPVKIKVTDCSGAPVSGLTLTVHLALQDTSAVVVNELVSTSAADSGITMRFTGAPDNQYIFNLSTKRSQFNLGQDLVSGSYRVWITSPVIATAEAYFDARK